MFRHIKLAKKTILQNFSWFYFCLCIKCRSGQEKQGSCCLGDGVMLSLSCVLQASFIKVLLAESATAAEGCDAG